MTAFQQYVDLTRILQEENEELVKEAVRLMQKNIASGYVDKLVSRYTNVSWRLLPANEIEDILKKEGLLPKEYIYSGRDDTHSCLIFMPRGGFLAGAVQPETIISMPQAMIDAEVQNKEAEVLKSLEASQSAKKED